MKFRDRRSAGRRLAELLAPYTNRPEVVVLALPRGGVPVAYEVARELHAPLDVFLVRKLGLPGQEELAMGAIATGGVRILSQDLIEYLRVPPSVIDRVTKREQVELERRERLYRKGRSAPDLLGKTVILVDDGLATGASMRAATTALRKLAPARIVVAVPVGSSQACREMRQLADECVCAATPEPFYGVGMWYDDFSQTEDSEVQHLLDRAAFERSYGTSRTEPHGEEGRVP